MEFAEAIAKKCSGGRLVGFGLAAFLSRFFAMRKNRLRKFRFFGYFLLKKVTRKNFVQAKEKNIKKFGSLQKNKK